AYLETWQKDGQDIHDFIADDVRVEVKTSAFQNRQAVSIHGLKQLAAPESADLVLAVAEIEKHGNGETLDDVVDRILDQGTELGMMSEKLAAAGFVRGMTSADEEQRFTLRSWRYWEITGGLPVLNLEAVGAEVALAISDVRYSLNLSSLGESRETFDWSRFTSRGSG
ncbi:PD-(D/E)XK motif protein, partial [Garicola koreensis]